VGKTAVIGPRLKAEMAFWSVMEIAVLVAKVVGVGEDIAW
jgi:hypothetical protein